MLVVHSRGSLGTLNLSDNRLYLVPIRFTCESLSLYILRKFSASLRNLHTLNLSNNRLLRLYAGDFNGSANLQALHLEGNQIEAIDPLTFVRLRKLKVYIAKLCTCFHRL